MKKGALLVLTILTITNIFAQEKKELIVTATELKEWITYLASDEMKGRANGSPEMKAAADWIVGKFRVYGVTPINQDSGYIQNYIFTSRQRTIPERNVIGIIEGTDPLLKDQFIVLSAHFDHIGIRHGLKPDSINNGADDNAAGICTILGIAETISLSKLKPGRTIVLAAFSGEEYGMRGSRYFVANPPVPLKNIYADLNFEMTGHSEYLGRNKYYMTGCSFSNLDDLIGEYNKGTDFQLIDTIPIANMLFNSSDNIAFSRVSVADGITLGIPSGTFATSATADYLHNVTDEAELFDYDNMAALIGHFSDLVIWLSNNKSDIIWTDPKFSRIK
jgi:Zn-dependent M28 family amino/carboxypeptidase